MNIQDIMRGLPLPVQGLLMQAYGATANQQPQQNAGGGRGFVNPPLVNPNAAPPQMPRVQPSRPVGVPKDEAGFEDMIARIMAGGSTDELQNAPAAAPTPVQAAMEPDLPAPAASDASFEAALKSSQEPPAPEGLLSRFGFSDGNQAMGALGAALAAAGSADPAKTALGIQAQRAEEAKLREATRRANQPKFTPLQNGAFVMAEVPGMAPQVLPISQVQNFIQETKRMEMMSDAQKAAFLEKLKFDMKTQFEADKDAREKSTEKVQAGLNVQELNAIADSLGKTDTATGPLIGLLPKWARDIVTPGGASLQDRAERVIQGGLRATLGGQFTQAEGDRFLARAYNPRLSEEQNIQSLQTIAREIAAMQLDKPRALEYFKQKGTLEGFVPNANPGAAAPAASATPPPSTDLRARVTAAGIAFEPEKFDYRIGPKGEIQRKAK